jgi:hypothetical protein
MAARSLDPPIRTASLAAKLGECDMTRNKPGLIRTLVAVGALGATAGMLALRWSQRHRMQRQSFHRDLSRWEGEGGALVENGSGALSAAVGAGTGSMGDPMGASHMARRDHAIGTHGSNGTTSDDPTGAWPFPHGSGDPATRH